VKTRLLAGIVCLLLALRPCPGAEAQSFDSNGVKIHFTVEGKGEPVVLIHGFTATGPLNWAAPGVVKALAADYQVITLDARGHGKSGKPHDPKKYGQEMVEDVVRLLDHLKVKKAHVVGYSMGGFITLKLLATHPERVQSATLGGSGWFRLGDKERGSIGEELAKSLEAGKGIEPLILRLTPPGQPKPTPEQIKLTNQLVLSVNDPKALAAVARGFQAFVVPEEKLKANKVPTLALIGSLDPVKELLDEMKDKTANLQVVVIDGAHHMNTVGRPEFIDNLKKFLAKNGAAGKR
jgi:pimeloyl-ACP methyl ester carboxylesterase